jgi:uncharacterized protein YndB with AHSA1/START domain
MKKILLSLVAILLLIVAASFFVAKDFAVEREIVINKPSTQIFDFVVLLKNQEKYGAWSAKDPTMKKDFKGEDGTVGAKAMWWSDNKDVGVGEQEIAKITPKSRIDYQLRFKEPFESESASFMTTEAIDSNTTIVRWGFSGSMPRPLNLMMLFMDMDKEGGKDFEEGLANLKKLMEKEG